MIDLHQRSEISLKKNLVGYPGGDRTRDLAHRNIHTDHTAHMVVALYLYIMNNNKLIFIILSF